MIRWTTFTGGQTHRESGVGWEGDCTVTVLADCILSTPVYGTRTELTQAALTEH